MTNDMIEQCAKIAENKLNNGGHHLFSTRKALNRVIDEIRAMPVPSPWRDIESAPKDGTRCLFFAKANKQCFYKAGKKDQIRVDFWKDTGFHKMFPQCPYTHWMPLPESPPS